MVLRDVPADSTVVGVPGHIVFRNGKRVVITDPKQINDPLSEALAAVATEVRFCASRFPDSKEVSTWKVSRSTPRLRWIIRSSIAKVLRT